MTIQLTLGNDIFDGTESDDTILGLDGNDIIRGLDDNDVTYGNQGNDQIFGDLGDDTLYGGKEDDIAQGGTGNDYVFGDLGNDTLWGDDGDDLVFGGLGNDLIYGNRGNDVLYGNEGDDTLYGGKENDTLFGASGNDFLSGDLGNDVLFGDEGTNTISGGSGNDIFVLQRKFAATTLDTSDVIVDFTKGQDKIGLTGDLTFEELAIYGGVREYLGDTIIQDKNSGRFFALLKNVDSTTLTASDFTTNLTPVGSPDPEQVLDPTVGEDTLSFEIEESGFEEGGTTGTVTITVQREGPARGIALVDYATVEGTARAGSDFQATGGSLIFNPG
jgi:Ca2+-binding RTX toxin-like protein